MVGEEMRPPEEVLRDHLDRGKRGSVEDDLARNYAADVVCLTRDGVHKGHDGVRRLAERLRRELPGGSFHYETVLVAGDVAFLEWTARCPEYEVRDGADSFVIRDGRIVAQTIHYTIRPRG